MAAQMIDWIQKVSQLGFELPAAPKPVGAYLPARRSGKLVFTAGQLAMKDGKLLYSGKTPADVSLENARRCAAQAVLNALAAARSVMEPREDIAAIIRMNVFVNSSPGFTDQAQVANSASELLTDIFGERGRHARCAIGAAELPLNSPVELDLVIELV